MTSRNEPAKRGHVFFNVLSILLYRFFDTYKYPTTSSRTNSNPSTCKLLVATGKLHNRATRNPYPQAQVPRMAARKHFDSSRPCWFLSVSGEGSGAAEHLISENIWQGSDDNPYPPQALAIKEGDHIALRTNAMLKTGLPFDNRQCVVPVMSVIATGIVKQNPQENAPLQVDWKPLPTPRAWYLYTNQKEVWPVRIGDWMADNLVDFTSTSSVFLLPTQR